MEANSDRDKSEFSFSDCETYDARSIRSKQTKRKGLTKTLWSSCDKLPSLQNSQLLSSISSKLKPSNIEVFSKQIITKKPKQSRTNLDKMILSISCFPQLPSCNQNLWTNTSHCVEYEQLKRKKNQMEKIIENVHSSASERRGCLEVNCPIKRKWMRKVSFYQRELKNVRILRESSQSCPLEVESQIDKDVTRTFAPNVVTRTKLTVSQSVNSTDKLNLLECIRGTLKLYASVDPQVGYVQGMNLLCGAVAFHMKDVNNCFIFFKEIMYYGKLREFYLDNFSLLSQELQDLFHRQLKLLNMSLYDFFTEAGIDHIIFLPYYLTLFASIVDIRYMVSHTNTQHIIIDLYLREGVNFLHKFLLGLLLLMKDRLMAEGEEDSVLMKLGSSYIGALEIDWEDVIVNCLKIDII